MAIVSSTIKFQFPMPNGRTQVFEEHTDSVGTVHVNIYIAEVGADISALLTANATALTATLARSELDAQYNDLLGKLGTGFTVQLNNITATQWRNFIRAKYLHSTQLESCIIARYVLTFSDAQIKNAFNINDAQLAALKLRLQAKEAKLADMEDETGE